MEDLEISNTIGKRIHQNPSESSPQNRAIGDAVHPRKNPLEKDKNAPMGGWWSQYPPPKKSNG